MLKTLAHVFAVGNLDSDVNLKEGNGENPSGSSLGIPVANAIMFLSVIEKVFPSLSPHQNWIL